MRTSLIELGEQYAVLAFQNGKMCRRQPHTILAVRLGVPRRAIVDERYMRKHSSPVEPLTVAGVTYDVPVSLIRDRYGRYRDTILSTYTEVLHDGSTNRVFVTLSPSQVWLPWADYLVADEVCESQIDEIAAAVQARRLSRKAASPPPSREEEPHETHQARSRRRLGAGLRDRILNRGPHRTFLA